MNVNRSNEIFMEQNKNAIRTTKCSSPIRYDGNLFFLIFFLFLWLPIGILLLLKYGSLVTGTSKFYVVYHGKWRWLFLWAIIFFPISIALFLIKGAEVIEEVPAEG